MLTPTGLLWTEIAACLCLAILSCWAAYLWTKRMKVASGGYSVVASSMFGSIGGVLIAHALEGTATTTAGGPPFAVIFLPVAAIVVACGALVACFRTRDSSVRGALIAFSGASGVLGVLFFWLLGVVH